MDSPLRRAAILSLVLLAAMSLSSTGLGQVSEDAQKEIVALKQEVAAAQAKLDQAPTGQTIERITIPVSIGNIRRILGELSQKASQDAKLRNLVKDLEGSLQKLETARVKNDRTAARSILAKMTARLAAADAVMPLPGVDLVVSRIEVQSLGGERWRVVPYIRNRRGSRLLQEFFVWVMVRKAGYAEATLDAEGSSTLWGQVQDLMREARDAVVCPGHFLTVRGIGPGEVKPPVQPACAFELTIKEERAAHIYVVVDPYRAVREADDENNHCLFVFNPSLLPASRRSGLSHTCVIRD